MGVERCLRIRQLRGHEVALNPGIDSDEGGEQIALFHQLAFENMDLLDDSVGECGRLDGEGIWLDPAGCLEKEGAGGTFRSSGFCFGFLLNTNCRENLDGLRRKQAVAEKEGK